MYFQGFPKQDIGKLGEYLSFLLIGGALSLQTGFTLETRHLCHEIVSMPHAEQSRFH